MPKRRTRRTRRTRRHRRQRGGGLTPQSLDEFNAKFPEAGLVSLPNNMFALGSDQGQFYLYSPSSHGVEYRDNMVKYITESVHPKLMNSHYYIVGCFWDGFGERMPIPVLPITYYMASKDQFNGASELSETDPHRYPLLHKRKYVFCFVRRIMDPFSICLPDPYFLKGVIATRLQDVDKARIPWEQKIARCIWKGEPSNGNNSCSGCYGHARNEFVEGQKAGKFPLADYTRDTMSLADQMRYKYILDINGWTTTWDATVWKLYSGSVMLKVDGYWEQWYYPKMKAGVHYILVKHDLSDLNETIQWCIDHDDECKTIVAAAQEFVKTEITPEAALTYSVEAIKKANTPMKGGSTGKSCDIVISRYKESLDWLTIFNGKPIRYIYIYNKGPEKVAIPKLQSKVIQIQLPNVGVCDHTYLYHIVNQYNTLADITVFLPASAHTNETKRQILDKLLTKVSEGKAAMHCTSYDGSTYDTFKDFTLDEWKVSDPANQENTSYTLARANPRPFGEWYKKFIPQTGTKRVSFLGMFSATKEAIRSHPIELYTRLVNQLNKDIFPEAAHYMERSWATLMPEHEVKCL